MIWAEKGQTNPDIELSSAKFTCGMRRKSAGGAWLEAKSRAHTPHTQCVEQSKSSDDGFVVDKSDDRVYLGTSIVDKYI